ncbi:hypothetical protein Q4601_14310 [Shewanella sp. 1_MG-2023]|uniref:hypothetical protein n=1 Tax=unclassified Shewanella TaxID=196818 RepID=UPI0026E14D0D|nr:MULTISPECIES: hypothetical protein [unclassified Shewanella]MDO6611382.1 hypothetical protein [Shewanella sp. 7_MG-2023]MDO6771237.1 hypothetical protein [Shewanella sp. 2_MG-2023]MDO6795478.1 hypothetical protein [Shewanella sp. 1_MG-2023]
MAKKGNSIAAVASRALGIEQKLLPERLRNRLNQYVKIDSLKKVLRDETEFESESVQYCSHSVRTGQTTFIRNLVILDTLFNDYKLVGGCLSGGLASHEIIEQFSAEWRAKKVLYQALESNISVLSEFFARDDIDWEKDEVPYPFRNGQFSSVELIAKSITTDNEPSVYDRAIKAVLTNQFSELGQVLEEFPNEFISVDRLWLSQLYQVKRQEYEEFYELLNKYN